MNPNLSGILAALSNAGIKVVARASMRHKQAPSVWLFSIVLYLGGTLIGLALFGLPSLAMLTGPSWPLFLLSGFLWATVNFCELKAQQNLDVALGSIFGTIRYVLLVLMSVLFYDESITPLGMCGVTMIMLAILGTAEYRSIKFRVGSLYRFASILIINVCTVIDKHLASLYSFSSVSVTAFYIPALLYVVLFPGELAKIPTEVKRSNGLILLAPVFCASYYFFYSYSYTHGELSVAATLGQTTVIFVYLFGLIFLNERYRWVRRGLGALLCAAGAALVSLKL